MNDRPVKTTRRLSLLLVGSGVALLLIVAVIAFRRPELWTTLQVYGYLGAFLISIAGGATILLPVPMLPVVFGLGALLTYPALVGVAAGVGETLGALTIYAMT